MRLRLAYIVIVALSTTALLAQNLEEQGKGNAGTNEDLGNEMHPMLDIDGPYQPTWESLDKHEIPEWFLNCKVGFSMHWGPYAVPAWASQKAGIGPGSYSEWYFNQMHIPDSPTRAHHDKIWGKDFAYDDFIPLFTAENFNANDWMKGLKENGIRYFFITSKHHDGFCLWDTKYTNRNSVKMGPKRDILRELVDAARKYGMKIGFYYSLYEWYNPIYVRELTKDTWLGDPETQKAFTEKLDYKGLMEHESYVDDFMVPQIVELIDKFQPDYLCFDGEWDHPVSYWRGRQIAAYYYNQAAKRGQEVLLNDRFGIGTRGNKGDFFHVEYSANIDKSLPWAMWRGFGKSFGHNTNEAPHAFLTPKQVVEMIVDCVSNNGNVEFNVGPTIDGRIDEPEWSLVQQMGAWLRTNGEAIYGAQSSPMGNLKFGRITHRLNLKKLYVHVFDWPNDGKITLKGIRNNITSVYVLSDKDSKLKVDQSIKGVKTIQAPIQAPGIHVPVLVVEYSGNLKVVEYMEYYGANDKGIISLKAEEALIRGSQLRFEADNKALGYWSNKKDHPLWGLNIEKTGNYGIVIELACPSAVAGGSFYIAVDGKPIDLKAKVPATSGWGSFKKVSLGEHKFKKGKYQIAVHSEKDGGALMNLRAIELKPN
ncbi:MAG: alpha-L-fucosidase [Cytophagales bacterium]|nr:alpha-L-fucosidase [Cytophagales bacterium]